tara:strand:+ start:234 stop:734 length:501 start_codon:yes stop_codon:yes gene_type:complete
MIRIYLGLGSNLRPMENLRRCVAELRQRFDFKQFSSVYMSAAIGFQGEDFLNAVVAVETDLCIEEVTQELELIHKQCGRERGTNAFMSRTLDIDLLLYGNDIIETYGVPRSDILEYSFVLCPLAEIAPAMRHPATGQSFAEHWEKFDKAAHPLKKLPINLFGVTNL